MDDNDKVEERCVPFSAQSILQFVKSTILDKKNEDTPHPSDKNLSSSSKDRPFYNLDIQTVEADTTANETDDDSICNPFTDSDSDVSSVVPLSCSEYNEGNNSMIPDIDQFSTLETNVECDVTTSSEKGNPFNSKETAFNSQETQANSPASFQILEPSVSKAIPGKLDKHQHCLFCKSKVQAVSGTLFGPWICPDIIPTGRHLTTLHKDEAEVAQLLAYKGSKSTYKLYKTGIRKLKCKGNFVFNIEVLNKGGHGIVVTKRTSKARSASDFLPCCYCLGFYVSEELWKHLKCCDLRESCHSLGPRKSLSACKDLLESACFGQDGRKVTRALQDILDRMKKDNLYNAVNNDPLLLQFGEVLVKKLGPARTNDISQRLRQAGRLKLKLNEISRSPLDFSQYVSGENFDLVISATEELCGVKTGDDGRRSFKIPSLAIRLGHILSKIANVKRGQALRNEDEAVETSSSSFLSLLKSEWTDNISSCALNTLKRRKDNRVQHLPLTEDLIKLKNYMTEKMQESAECLERNPDYMTWRNLSQMTMSRLILFNKRRGGEMSKLMLRAYVERPKWTADLNEEIYSTLESVERQLLKRMDLVQIPGKKNRKVPVLITTECKTAMDLLVKTRQEVGIPDSNVYFFASNSYNGFVDSWQAMRSVVEKADVRNPLQISSTRLRKYNATVCQIFDLKDGEMEWLANHMGHDINIHKDFYRLHDSTIELAKVSRILMAIDSGQAHKYRGKRLEEIAVDDDDDGNDGGDTLYTKDYPKKEAEEQSPLSYEALESDEETVGTQAKRRRRSPLDSSDDENEMIEPQKSGVRNMEPITKGIKLKWSNQEIATLKMKFGHLLSEGVYPSGQALSTLITQNSCFKSRTTAQIRSKLQHIMRKYN